MPDAPAEKRPPLLRRRLGWRLPGLALAFALGAVLPGCGGGGGGDSAGPAPGPGALSFGPITPSSITAEVPQGLGPPSVLLSSTVGGDVARLVGRTIFVRVQDPAGLYQPTATVNYDEATRRASLLLAGVLQNVVGERRSRVTIEVCEDAACSRPLTPTPLTVDVTVRVTAGLRVARETVTLSAPFGTLPSPTLLGVSTPEGTPPQDFRFSLLPPSSGSPPLAFDVSASDDAAQPGVRVTPRLMREGRYERVLQIESTANAGRENQFTYRSEVPLVLEVTPSAVDFAVLPAAVSIDIPVGDPFVRRFDVQTIARAGSFMLMAIAYDDTRNPPAAAGSPVLGQWLRNEGGFVAGGCINDTCLPAGSYHASLRFERFGEDGFSTGQAVTVPVTMTLR